MSKASDAQKARWAAWRKMKKEQNESFRDFVDRQSERQRAAEWCDENIDALLLLGEIYDETRRRAVKASSLEQERESALLFCAALKIKDPIIEGVTTRELLRRTYYEWVRQGRPLLNPITHCFSTTWGRQPGSTPRTFDEAWDFLSNCDYDSPLLPAASAPKSVEQRFNEWQAELRKDAPTMLYSGVILPHSDE